MSAEAVSRDAFLLVTDTVRSGRVPLYVADLAAIVRAYGGRQAETARALGVSPSRITRWAKGEDRPSLAATRAITDLSHVIARAAQMWAGESLRIWLASPNGYLDGATPLDVVRTRGASDVLEAIDAAESGAFA